MKENNDLIIKCATSEDINALCQFEVQARLTEPDIWCDEFNKNEFKEQLEKFSIEQVENNKIVIAQENGVIVGRCDIALVLSTVDFEKTGYIDWIYVLKNKRGIGIGKKLFHGAEEYFREKEVKQYYLYTASNEQAQEFYHRQKEFDFSHREVAEKELK